MLWILKLLCIHVKKQKEHRENETPGEREQNRGRPRITVVKDLSTGKGPIKSKVDKHKQKKAEKAEKEAAQPEVMSEAQPVSPRCG